MPVSFIFKFLLIGTQLFTVFVTSSLIISLYVRHFQGIWLDIIYTMGCWTIIVWLSKQDVAVLYHKFKDYFFEEDEE